MQIIKAKPPIFEDCIKAFGIGEKDKIVFSYGDILYNPNNANITPDLIRHEETHAEQQHHDPIVAKIWWQRYIADTVFRIEEEIQAYGEQYKFVCASVKDRNKRAQWLHEMASQLSGPIYGTGIAYSEARKRIKDYAEGKDLKTIEDYMKE